MLLLLKMFLILFAFTRELVTIEFARLKILTERFLFYKYKTLTLNTDNVSLKSFITGVEKRH